MFSYHSYFVDLLRAALAAYRNGTFEDFANANSNVFDVLMDNDEYEDAFFENNYLQFAQELLDCWIDSNRRPNDYPNIGPDDWPEVAESFLDDVSQNRTPTNPLWNEICTLSCPDCRSSTHLRNGIFECMKCARPVPFIVPTRKC